MLEAVRSEVPPKITFCVDHIAAQLFGEGVEFATHEYPIFKCAPSP
jgi:hypothetical protein